MSALDELTKFVSTITEKTKENPQGIVSSILVLEKAGMASIAKAMENFSEAPKYFGEMIRNYEEYAERSQKKWEKTFKELIERQKKIVERVEKFQKKFEEVFTESKTGELIKIQSLSDDLSGIKNTLDYVFGGFDAFGNRYYIRIEELAKNVSQTKKILEGSLIDEKTGEIITIPELKDCIENFRKDIKYIFQKDPQSDELMRMSDVKSYLKNIIENVNYLRSWLKGDYTNFRRI